MLALMAVMMVGVWVILMAMVLRSLDRSSTVVAVAEVPTERDLEPIAA